MMSGERARLAERRALVLRDLDELAEQVDSGEIDAVAGDELRRSYQDELSTIDAALGELPEEPPPAEAPPTKPQRTGAAEPTRSGSVRRMVVGSVLVIVAVATAVAFLARDTTPKGAVSGSPGELSIDPASVSDDDLEAVVAANPDVIGMRMALADRYVAEEKYSEALDHYLYIVDAEPTPTDESKALGRIGWLAYLTGLPEAANDYVGAALQVDPANAEATIFRGLITWYGLGDADTAIPQIETALKLPGLSADMENELQTALADARQGGGG